MGEAKRRKLLDPAWGTVLKAIKPKKREWEFFSCDIVTGDPDLFASTLASVLEEDDETQEFFKTVKVVVWYKWGEYGTLIAFNAIGTPYICCDAEQPLAEVEERSLLSDAILRMSVKLASLTS